MATKMAKREMKEKKEEKERELGQVGEVKGWEKKGREMADHGQKKWSSEELWDRPSRGRSWDGRGTP